MKNQISLGRKMLFAGCLIYPLNIEAQDLPVLSIKALTPSVVEGHEILIEISSDKTMEWGIPVGIIESGDTHLLNQELPRYMTYLLYFHNSVDGIGIGTIDNKRIAKDGTINIHIEQQEPPVDYIVDKENSSVSVTILDNDG